MLRSTSGAAALQITIDADVLAAALSRAFAEVVTPPPAPAPLPRLLSVAEFAQLVGISHQLISRYLRSGEIHGVRFGTRWLIPEMEFTRLIEVGGIAPAEDEEAES